MKKGSSLLSMLIALVVVLVLFYVVGPSFIGDKGIVGRTKNSASTYNHAKTKANEIVKLSKQRGFKTR